MPATATPEPAPPDAVADARRVFSARLFPDGTPPLWCALLTHYDKDGAIDEKRTLAHLDQVANFIDGVLVPGTTGDAWQLSEAERLRTLGLVLDQATRLRLRILVGVLKPDTASARACLVGTVEWLKARTGEPDTERCIHRRRIAAFTLCPPTLPQASAESTEAGLDSLLETGLPIALYNVPQITHHPLEPTLVARLASRHPNLLLFKDSGGTDAVARSLPASSGVFLLRGVEGDYTRWLRRAGGCYDGLLLSSANCFGRDLRRLWRDLGRKRLAEAQVLSDRLTAVLHAVFSRVAEVCEGNASAHAARAIDHFMAFGPHAGRLPPPHLHGGLHLPLGVIRQTGDALKQHGFLPDKGYLE